MSRKIHKYGIHTRWRQDVNLSCPLPEYPRPQLARERWQSLNGIWKYAIMPYASEICPQCGEDIVVPFCIESELSGVQKALKPNEYLWYRRTFMIPKDWDGSRILLHFGAVDWEAKIYVNGKIQGMHQGGYLPFTLDITDALFSGVSNELTVRVTDSTDSVSQQIGKQTLNPRMVYYTAVSGIWQTVWMEPVPQTYITSIDYVPDIDTGIIGILVHTSDASGKGTITLKGPDSSAAVSSVFEAEKRVRIPLFNVRCWSPEDPFLYKVSAVLENAAGQSDQVSGYCAMRKISLMKDASGNMRVALNNRPYFEYGLLDQGYWPESLYTAPADDAIRFDIEQCRELGFNVLRKHIKVESARWYYWCDRLGMIVWQDMPSGGYCSCSLKTMILGKTAPFPDTTEKWYREARRSAPQAREDFEQELYDMIGLLKNVPCICVWVPFNESWGQFNASEISSRIKREDPTRLVDHASGWMDQKAGDFTSRHIYSKLKDAVFQYARAYAVTECGGFSLTVMNHVWCNRYFGYQKFKSADQMMDRYASFIEHEVLPLKHQGCSAVIYTELSDVEQEVNGIFTYDREVLKMDRERLAKLNKEVTDQQTYQSTVK